MDALYASPNLDEALLRLELRDLQGILTQQNQSIQGNVHVLRARLKRLVEAHRAEQSQIPVSIGQAGASNVAGQSAASDQVRARSTENFALPPSPEETLNVSNISPISPENRSVLNNTFSTTMSPTSVSNTASTVSTTQLTANLQQNSGGNIFTSASLPFSTASTVNAHTHTSLSQTQPTSCPISSHNLTNQCRTMYNLPAQHPVNPNVSNLSYVANYTHPGQNNALLPQSGYMPNNTSIPNQMNMFELFSNFMTYLQSLNTQNGITVPQVQMAQDQTVNPLISADSNPAVGGIPMQHNQTMASMPPSPSSMMVNVSSPHQNLPTEEFFARNSHQTLENLMDQNLDLGIFDQQVPPKYGVDVKRISHISSTLEKRKVFFSGRAGSDPYRFITYLEESARFMGLSDSELFCSLPIVLTNEALEWFRLEERKMVNFAAFKSAFLEHYKIPYYQDRLMEDARKRTQALSESITSFVTCIRIIFDKMSPPLSLSRQLDMACQNLNPTYSMQINRDQISSFEELLNAGKRVEIKLINLKKYKEPPPPDTAVLSNAAWHPPKDAKQQSKKQQKANNDNKVHPRNEVASAKDISISEKNLVHKKPDTPKKEKVGTPKQIKKTVASPKPAESKKDITQHPDLPRPGECFKCRQTGHLFKACTNDPVFRIFCYSCGRAKVIATKCPTCKRDGEGNVQGGQPK